MKKTTFLLFVIFTINGFGQNLIPNGDFESFSNCPSFAGQINNVNFWITPTTNQMSISGTPDYYNQCSPSPYVSVPINWGGGELSTST